MSKTILKKDGKSINNKAFREVLLDNGVATPDELSEVKTHIVNRIENIVGGGVVSGLLINLLRYNLINLEQTDSGEYPSELEIKVKNVTLKSIEKKLGKSLNDDLGYPTKFHGEISDVYYTDDESLESGLKNASNGNKCSLRIREKIKTHDENNNELDTEEIYPIYYCTLKIKDKIKTVLDYMTKEGKEVRLEFRKCHEEEFKLAKPMLFEKLLIGIGLKEQKSKFKKRKQIEVLPDGGLVVDAEDYLGEKGLVEFEGQSPRVIAYHMEDLGVIYNETSAGGSGTLDRESEAEILRYRKK